MLLLMLLAKLSCSQVAANTSFSKSFSRGLLYGLLDPHALVTHQPVSLLVPWQVLECIFFACVLWNLWEEIREMQQCRRIYGTTLSYFDSAWNWIDLTSIALQLVGIGLW